MTQIEYYYIDYSELVDCMGDWTVILVHDGVSIQGRVRSDWIAGTVEVRAVHHGEEPVERGVLLPSVSGDWYMIPGCPRLEIFCGPDWEAGKVALRGTPPERMHREQTMEEVNRRIGIPEEVNTEQASGSGCGMMPDGVYDNSEACNKPPSWHYMLRSDKRPEARDGAIGFLSCEEHREVVTSNYGGALIDSHKVGLACGLEGAMWIPNPGGLGSKCVVAAEHGWAE